MLARVWNSRIRSVLWFESLESRDVPATLVGSGNEFPVAYEENGHAPVVHDVATNSDGYTVAAWLMYDLKSVKAQRYDPSGNAVGSLITVVSATAQYDHVGFGNVDIDDSNNFVVGYNYYFAQDGKESAIVKKINWNGGSVGTVVVASDYQDENNDWWGVQISDVAVNHNGEVVVGWFKAKADPGGASPNDFVEVLQTTTYNNQLVKQADTVVATYDPPDTGTVVSSPGEIRLARSGTNQGWVTTWGVVTLDYAQNPNGILVSTDLLYKSYGETGSAGSTGTVGGDLYGVSGGPANSSHAVAMQDNGNFIVAWLQNDSDFMARRYGSNGGSEFTVTSGDAWFGVDVAVDSQGRTVFAYSALNNEAYMRYQEPAGSISAAILMTTGNVGTYGSHPKLGMSEIGTVFGLFSGWINDGNYVGFGLLGRRFAIQ